MKKSLLWSTTIVTAAIAIAAANAQTPPGPQMRGDGPPPESKPFSITKNDPALDQIILPDAELVELARGFGLTEAGLWMPEGKSGYWIFGGLLANVLYKVTPDKKVSVFMEHAGEPKKQICATNEAFGGPDGKTLFIAGCDAVFTIRLKTEGIVPAFNVKK